MSGMDQTAAGHTGGRAGLLRHGEDRRALAFVALTLALLITPLTVPLPAPLAPAWIAVSALFCFNACIVNHNHVHLGIFRRPALNRGLSLALTLAKGHSATGVVVAHNLNHHRHHGGEADWARCGLAGTGPGAARLARYLWRASLEMARGRASAQAPRLPAALRRQLRRERQALAGFILWAAYTDAHTAAVFIALPWLAGMAALVGVNLLQHDGCDPASAWGHSRNFTGRLGNWFFFNNGLHTAHHLQPALHWSLLPQAHRALRARLVPGLEEPSILRFLLREYLLRPGPPPGGGRPGMPQTGHPDP